MGFSDIRFIVASDTLLACLFPFLILVIGYKYFPAVAFSDIRDILFFAQRKPGLRHGHFSLERAFNSYQQYGLLSKLELSKMRFSYGTSSRANKKIGFKIGYPKKLDLLQDVTNLNQFITDRIVDLALDEFPHLHTENRVSSDSADLVRVRESLKHFVRDWSEEGAAERTRIFAPILDLLQEVDAKEREGMKILVPGCGLGRLAWEIAQLGFDTTANELSFFMTLAFRFLLSPKYTNSPNEHNLRPYAHWFSHQKSNNTQFRAISFPDVVPRLGPNLHLVEEDFMKISSPSLTPTASSDYWTHKSASHYLEGYHFVVTLFFIDTSLDVIATMSHIYNLLRPGGIWVNLGPLLWTGSAQAKVELTLDEVLEAAQEIGFIIEKGETGPAARKTVECEYTGDKLAMMRWIYKAEFWVARKSK